MVAACRLCLYPGLLVLGNEALNVVPWRDQRFYAFSSLLHSPLSDNYAITPVSVDKLRLVGASDAIGGIQQHNMGEV